MSEILTDIYQAQKQCKLYSSAEFNDVIHKGWFSEIEAWYHHKNNCKQFAPEHIEENNHVTCGNKYSNGVFKVCNNEGIVEYIPHTSGLHYLDLKDDDADIALFTMIRENVEGYTKSKLKGPSRHVVSK